MVSSDEECYATKVQQVSCSTANKNTVNKSAMFLGIANAQ